MRRARARAAGEGADLILFPELFIAGYPPEDLVLKPAFQAACRAAVEALARETGRWRAGRDRRHALGRESGKLYNAIALLDGGRIAALRFKVDLPNYGVFDEKRVFAPGPLPGPVNFRGVRIGVPICEDIWGPEPAECIAETGGEILLVPNGSPYRRDVIDERLNVAVARVKEYRFAADLSQPGRRTGRTRVRGRLLRAECRRLARGPASGLRRSVRDYALGAHGRRLALRAERPIAQLDEATRPITRPACWACATMSSKNGFQGRGARLVGRHRFRACAPRSASMRSAPSACAR